MITKIIKPPLPEFLERMLVEYTELNERLIRLHTFINKNPAFYELDEQDRELLREQFRFMCSYSEVLWKRIGKKTDELQVKA